MIVMPVTDSSSTLPLFFYPDEPKSFGGIPLVLLAFVVSLGNVVTVDSVFVPLPSS